MKASGFWHGNLGKQSFRKYRNFIFIPEPQKKQISNKIDAMNS